MGGIPCPKSNRVGRNCREVRNRKEREGARGTLRLRPTVTPTLPRRAAELHPPSVVSLGRTRGGMLGGAARGYPTAQTYKGEPRSDGVGSLPRGESPAGQTHAQALSALLATHRSLASWRMDSYRPHRRPSVPKGRPRPRMVTHRIALTAHRIALTASTMTDETTMIAGGTTTTGGGTTTVITIAVVAATATTRSVIAMSTRDARRRTV